MRFSRSELRAQHARVTREGPLPFAELAPLAGVAVTSLIRWATRGKDVNGRRAYLDAIRDRRTGQWFSSLDAAERFLHATAAEPADVA